MNANGDTQQLLRKGKEHFRTMHIPEVQIKTNINQLHYAIMAEIKFSFTPKRTGIQVGNCLRPFVCYIFIFAMSFAIKHMVMCHN